MKSQNPEANMATHNPEIRSDAVLFVTKVITEVFNQRASKKVVNEVAKKVSSAIPATREQKGK
jgi:hypothetical protein